MRRKASATKRRTQSRRVNLIPVYLLVGVLLVLVFAVLSLTVLFKLDTFLIEGDVPYSNERIIEASGLALGENLIRLDEEEAEKNILANLPYVESVTVKTDLPATVYIELTAAEEYAYLKDGNYSWIINSHGRVLKKADMEYDGLIKLTGALPPQNELRDNAADGQRTYLTFDDPRSAEALEQLSSELAVSDIGDITRIHINSYLDIIFVIDDRIRVEIGTMVDMDYKMRYVRRLFSEGEVPSEGLAVINVSNTDRVSLKTNVTGDIKIEDILSGIEAS